MLPTINGKSLLQCKEEDFKQILDNPDYRESEYIDYKRSFALLHTEDKKDRARELAELRSDVCSFANANGGYLVFGIQESGGIPESITGICLTNNDADKFELNLKNWLHTISPKMPLISTAFVELHDEKFLIVLQIGHDAFSPYVHVENEKDYRIYKRVGNSKMTIGYSELRSMFNQSMVIEREIDKFRKERIDAILEKVSDMNEPVRFLVVHIIPDTFLNGDMNIPLLFFERKGKRFGSIFIDFDCEVDSVPMVEGLRFNEYKGNGAGRLYNNGIAEGYCSKLYITMSDDGSECIPWKAVWDNVQKFVKKYIDLMAPLLNTEKVYLALSLIGCEGVRTYKSYEYFYAAKIDRDKMFMNVIPIENICNEEQVEEGLKHLILEYMLSLGIKTKDYVNDELLEELFGK